MVGKRKSSRRRYTEAQRKRFYKQWLSSGISRRAFCRKSGLNEHTFTNWCARFKAASGSDATHLEDLFIPLTSPSQAGRPIPACIRICYGDGTVVELSGPVPPEFIHALLPPACFSPPPT